MKYIYLLKSYENGYYKIGLSKNPFNRIKQLQTGNPEKIELIASYKSVNYLKVETALHNYFSHSKTINEWFNLSLEDELKFIDLCKKFDKNIEILKESHIFN